jgi:hypothetical protein
MFKVFPASLQTLIDTRLTLTPSVILNSNYVIVVSDLNFLNIFDHPVFDVSSSGEWMSEIYCVIWECSNTAGSINLKTAHNWKMNIECGVCSTIEYIMDSLYDIHF